MIMSKKSTEHALPTGLAPKTVVGVFLPKTRTEP
jgi:hypothetical protein